MQRASVRISSDLLFDRHLSSSAKLVRMVLGPDRLDQGNSPLRLSPSRLADQTGLSRPTVRKAIRVLQALRREQLGGSDQIRTSSRAAAPETRESPAGSTPADFVRIPMRLLSEKRLNSAAKVLYGILIALARGNRRLAGRFTHLDLSRITGWSPKTVRRSVRSLAQRGWLSVKQKNRLAPIHFTIQDPAEAAVEFELDRVKRRLNKAAFRGEALMREYLSLLIDSDQFEDDAAPGFLVNPLTDERLQLDRYYPPGVAFEFNGAQHYVPTEKYPEEVVKKQRLRDCIKIGICVMKGIELRVIQPKDLSLSSMKRKVGDLLPLRDLSREGPRIAFLERLAYRYRKAAERGPFTPSP